MPMPLSHGAPPRPYAQLAPVLFALSLLASTATASADANAPAHPSVVPSASTDAREPEQEPGVNVEVTTGFSLGYGAGAPLAGYGMLVQFELLIDRWVFAGGERWHFGNLDVRDADRPFSAGTLAMSAAFGARIALDRSATPTTLQLLAGPVMLLGEARIAHADTTPGDYLGAGTWLRIGFPERSARKLGYASPFTQLAWETYPGRIDRAGPRWWSLSLSVGSTWRLL
jgi:hypothetical protein